MTTQHTSGPWAIVTDQYHPPLITAWNDSDGSTDDIAEIFGGVGEKTAAANARLIAAAPELLAASVALMDVLRDQPKGPQHEAMVNLADAISKATQHQ